MAKKILLVEDDLILLEMYQKKFTNEGFIIYTAHNGEEGLKSALKDNPDLIILDLAMPVMDGMTMMELQGVLNHRPAYYLRKINTTPQEVVQKAKEILNLFA